MTFWWRNYSNRKNKKWIEHQISVLNLDVFLLKKISRCGYGRFHSYLLTEWKKTQTDTCIYIKSTQLCSILYIRLIQSHNKPYIQFFSTHTTITPKIEPAKKMLCDETTNHNQIIYSLCLENFVGFIKHEFHSRIKVTAKRTTTITIDRQ